MQYRSLTKDNIPVSALGFGCMRFPLLKSGKVGKPDRREAIRMLHYGIENGINYLDTAYPYHDGASEEIVGRALATGKRREQVLLATKFPTWEATSQKQLDRIFHQQLERLRTDYIDAYLLHNLQKAYMPLVEKFKMIEWAEKKRRQGKIRYVGFSFHDDLPLFKTIIDSHSWDFCQIQYNYVGEQTQAGTAGLKYAASRGISVVIMEPLFGGVLANPGGKMAALWQKSRSKPVDLALRWLWDKPEVSIVLSGMSSMEQTAQNIEIADRAQPGSLTKAEQAFIERVQKVYRKSMPVACTKCRYCLPCPASVDIPMNFAYYNDAVAAPESIVLNKTLYGIMPPEHRASHCTACGECESKCPQHLPIRKHLKEVSQLLG